jgi:flagellar M-ring protein FliF
MFAFLQKLSLRQKLMIGGVVLAAIAAIIALVSYVNRPSYGTLFSNLNTQDASKVVEKLKDKGVPFVLENEGRAILVPKAQLYELRLSLAGEGLPQTSVIGYEIFDRTNLGVSDFVQKVNYRRAVEGELARTILQLDEVEAARVHIVVPEKTLFTEDEKQATASVVLKLKTGRPIRQESIQGIMHLIASSVEGLDAGNVSILDSRGVLLTENNKSNSLASLTTTQYDLQRRVETYLAQKAQALLDGVLGTGNAIVQVNAELDFRQVERTLEQYDPDRTAVRSEQSFEEKNNGKDTGPTSNRTNTVANYEVNRSIEHIVENQGNIKRLTVATLVNSTETSVERDGQKVLEYVLRSELELNKLSEIVKSAVGYNATRADEISVVNLPFSAHQMDADLVYKDSPLTRWTEYIDTVIIVVAMLVGIFMLYRLLARFRKRFIDAASVVVAEGFPGAFEAVLDGAERTGQLAPSSVDSRKRLTRYVKEQPDQASRLLKMWIADK